MGSWYNVMMSLNQSDTLKNSKKVINCAKLVTMAMTVDKCKQSLNFRQNNQAIPNGLRHRRRQRGERTREIILQTPAVRQRSSTLPAPIQH